MKWLENKTKPLTIEGFIYFACCIANSLACIASFSASSMV
ncbi:hypothetical protein VPH95E331_0060 [Vibrio phage 95E33-1]